MFLIYFTTLLLLPGLAICLYVGPFNTKLKINNFNVNMSASYIFVENFINIYFQEFVLRYILPFKFCRKFTVILIAALFKWL